MSQKQFELAFEEAARELAFDGKLDESVGVTLVSPLPGMPAIHVAYQGGSDAVVLFSEIGHVPDEDLGLYREFLEESFMQRGTRGAAFAVNPENGVVVLQQELPADRIDGPFLAAVFGDFAEVAFRARRRLFRKAEAEHPSPEIPGIPHEEPNAPHVTGLRV